MKANNLSISIPNKGCNKNCPYCVSRMTPEVPVDFKTMKRNITKVHKFAETCGITSVSLTGKGEPTLAWNELITLLEAFNDFPTELQTNGKLLANNNFDWELLYASGLDVLALSVDNINDFYSDRLDKVTKIANSFGLVVRMTVNMTKMLPPLWTLHNWIEFCHNNKIQQLSFRQVTIPNGASESKYSKWIEKNADNKKYILLMEELLSITKNQVPLRVLPYGAVLYDISGVAVTFFDYCIQDTTNGEDLRSLIFNQDGHLYTSWGSTASILF